MCKRATVITHRTRYAKAESRCSALQVLFMFGNVVKTLFAKMMSSHYYKASQFEKLQDALKKARLAWFHARGGRAQQYACCVIARTVACVYAG